MRKYEGVWRKRQLLPCWIPQFVGSITLGVFACLILISIKSAQDYHDYDGVQDLNDFDDLSDAPATIVASVVLGIAAVTIVLDIIEVVLFAKRKLNPVVLLAFAVFKVLGWGSYCVLAIIAAVRDHVGVVDIPLSVILLGSSLTQLIFGAIYTRVKSKGFFDGGNYRRTEGDIETKRLNPVSVYCAGGSSTDGYEAYRGAEVGPLDRLHPQAAAGNYSDQDVGIRQ